MRYSQGTTQKHKRLYAKAITDNSLNMKSKKVKPKYIMNGNVYDVIFSIFTMEVRILSEVALLSKQTRRLSGT